MQKLKLFCVPYAGGSAKTFLGWKKWLDPGIELIPVELAGRGARVKDQFYGNA
jgi:surfactin synthase thioesterase subunit